MKNFNNIFFCDDSVWCRPLCMGTTKSNTFVVVVVVVVIGLGTYGKSKGGNDSRCCPFFLFSFTFALDIHTVIRL